MRRIESFMFYVCGGKRADFLEPARVERIRVGNFHVRCNPAGFWRFLLKKGYPE